MAEEQFTSRRARREAERLAAEQAFEARETPEQPSEPATDGPADLLSSAPEPVEEPEPEAVVPEAEAAEPEPEAAEPEPEAAEPEPEAAESVDSAARLDPQRSPLPHFETRSTRKAYLREHGLSLEGDVSTGAIPTIAEPEESVNDAELEEETTSENESVDPESFDTAGFGGSADEVAARDFESPVTPDSAPRPATLDEEPVDALSRPIPTLDPEDSSAPEDQAPDGSPTQDSPHSTDSPATDESTSETAAAAESITEEASEEAATPGAQDSDTDEPGLAEEGAGATAVPSETADDETAPRARSRRMPIVQPPTTSGVRVVTAASAQVPEVDSPETDLSEEADEAAKTEDAPGLDQRLDSEAEPVSYEEETASSSDDAARALAANPETRPMDTVPEAWALPNSDYEDEETENPPGTRIRASDVTGHDGRILVGEEPSKVPFVVLGVAAIFAVALIVIALIMLL